MRRILSSCFCSPAGRQEEASTSVAKVLSLPRSQSDASYFAARGGGGEAAAPSSLSAPAPSSPTRSQHCASPPTVAPRPRQLCAWQPPQMLGALSSAAQGELSAWLVDRCFGDPPSSPPAQPTPFASPQQLGAIKDFMQLTLQQGHYAGEFCLRELGRLLGHNLRIWVHDAAAKSFVLQPLRCYVLPDVATSVDLFHRHKQEHYLGLCLQGLVAPSDTQASLRTKVLKKRIYEVGGSGNCAYLAVAFGANLWRYQEVVLTIVAKREPLPLIAAVLAELGWETADPDEDLADLWSFYVDEMVRVLRERLVASWYAALISAQPSDARAAQQLLKEMELACLDEEL